MICVPLGRPLGIQNRPKIEQKSIHDLIYFLITFWKGKHSGKKEANLGTPDIAQVL